MFGLGTSELIIILVIVILIFGVNKIPQLGKGLGKESAISNHPSNLSAKIRTKSQSKRNRKNRSRFKGSKERGKG